MTFQLGFKKSNTTGVISRVGTAYTSGTRVNFQFSVDVVLLNLVFRVVFYCLYLFRLVPLFSWSFIYGYWLPCTLPLPPPEIYASLFAIKSENKPILETFSAISEMFNSQYLSNMPDKSIDILNNCWRYVIDFSSKVFLFLLFNLFLFSIL